MKTTFYTFDSMNDVFESATPEFIVEVGYIIRDFDDLYPVRGAAIRYAEKNSGKTIGYCWTFDIKPQKKYNPQLFRKYTWFADEILKEKTKVINLGTNINRYTRLILGEKNPFPFSMYVIPKNESIDIKTNSQT